MLWPLRIPLFALLLLPQFAQGTEMVGALSAGLGGTGRASIESSESLYLNPAAIALLGGFYSGFFWQEGRVDRDLLRRSYGITLTDGTPGLAFPGSLGYRRHEVVTSTNRFKEDEYKLGLSRRWNDRVSLGLGVSHLRAKDQVGQVSRQSNFDLGLLVGLKPNWGLAFTGENLMDRRQDVVPALRRNSYLTAATHYLIGESFSLRYELLLPVYLEQTQYLAHRWGTAVKMTANFFLNMGYSVDDSRQQNWASVGLAWRGPRLQLAYAYQSEGRSRLEDRHFIDLWFDL